MNGSKYYEDGQTNYSGSYGTIYFTPTGGSQDGDVNFMSTVNFSRTERAKNMKVENRDYDISTPFTVNQKGSELLILLDDINDKLSHGDINSFSVHQNQSYYTEYRYPIHSDDLGKTLKITVLVNGNVICNNTENGLVSSTSVIEEINNDIGVEAIDSQYPLPIFKPTSDPKSWYEDYPENVGTNYVSVYKIDKLSIKPEKNIFDEVQHTNGTATQITIPTGGGALATRELVNYGKINGLIGVTFNVTINDNTPASNSTIQIGTAVYKNSSLDGVDPECADYKELRILFEYDGESPSVEIDNDNLMFNPDGSEYGNQQEEHQPDIEITSNIPWTITY